MLSIAAVAALATTSFAASDLAGAFKEGKTSGQIRAMYIKNDLSSTANDAGTPDNSAFGLGGKLGFETAPLYGISAGAVFYTSQDLGTMNSNGAKVEGAIFDRAGSSTNKPSSYSLLGQAYVQGQFGKTTVKVGRQQIDTPLAGSDDIRVIPNLFEAALVINTDLPSTTLIGGYVARMAGLDSAAANNPLGGDSRNGRTAFQSMSRSALGGTVDLSNVAGSGNSEIGDKGVYVLAAVNNSIKDLTLQAWEYYAVDVVNAIYLQADYKLGLGKDMALNVAAQYYNIKDMGKTKDLLKATADAAGVGLGKVGYDVYGAKASLETPVGVTPYVAYNKVSEQNNGINGGSMVFGAWGGYPEFAIADEFWYNSFSTSKGLNNAMNGAQAYKVGVDYSLEKLGLGARTIGAAYTKYDVKNKYNTDGTNDIDADTGVWDIVYSCNSALVKNLDAKLVFESVDSKYNAMDRKTFKATLNYNF